MTDLELKRDWVFGGGAEVRESEKGSDEVSLALESEPFNDGQALAHAAFVVLFVEACHLEAAKQRKLTKGS